VGGKDLEIVPLFRNRNSGSQELFETLVMQGLTMPDWSEDNEVGGMLPIFTRVRGENGAALGFTVYYYKEQIIRDNSLVKTLAVNGVYPDKNTISNGAYPYVAEVYAVIRSDLDKSSMAYQLYELLQTQAGKKIIAESGYIPN
jgi:phosphate transport system substrate-binding protein